MNIFIINMFVLWKVWNTLKYGWGNVCGWPEQHWLMVGTTLTDGWGSVGRWLGQRWLMVRAMLAKVGATLVDGWDNVGTLYAVDVGATLAQRAM